MLFSYRNQSTDLHCKLVDWFLYECNVNPTLDKVVESQDKSVCSVQEYICIRLLHCRSNPS